MIIEDPDSFKNWLTAVLKPLCEADPGALAKYVFALVKKDKAPDVLRQSMINQLEVFLQNETEPFVELLFKTLDSRDYLTPVIPSANPPNPNIVKTDQTSPTKLKEVKREIIPVSELPNLSETVNGSAAVKKEKEVEVKREKDLLRKSDSEKEDKPKRRSRHRSLSRNRSRSRSWERNRRSRSREKSREREREPYRSERDKRDRPRPYRNKSPPRRYDRRRSRSGSPNRQRSRSRSPRHPYRGRYRNRSPPRSTSRSRSRSNDRKERKDSLKNDKESKDTHSGAGTPTQDSNHGDMDMRLTNSAQSIQSVVVHQNAAGNRTPKKRCRDYDEKGYCMRGEMCPYDHGMDPVVLEDSALSRVLTFTPNGAPVTDVPPSMIAPPIIGGQNHPMMHHLPPRPLQPEYNPQAPQMWHRPGFRGPRPMLGPRLPIGAFINQPNMQRELIPVPVLDSQQSEQFGNNFVRQPRYGSQENDQDNLFKKKAFDYNRLGPRAKNPSNCALELKKVPPGLNNIMHLNNHFAKFGKIVNIQVFFEGDPEAAIITFSSHAEANAAYRSTEAVLNNRFIKVFWHSSNSDVQPKAETGEEMSNFGVEKNSNFTKNNLAPKKEETKAQAAAAIKKGQELLAAKEKLKKNQEEKRKEALKLTQDLRKRKQELLEKQLAQQKLLIDKMEKTPAGPQRDLLLKTIKKSQESIEAIRKDMMSQPPMAAKVVQPRKSKEEAQKEMLDAELDLITKQQEGADTSELQKKLVELKAKISGVGRGRGGARGRRFNPISRHLLSKNNLIDNSGLKGNVKSPASRTSFQKHAVDHRPTRLLVSGYEADEQESVLTHFSQYGEIVDYVIDPATPSIVLNYKTRKEAEIALLKGKNFQDRTLSITWCTSAQLSSQLSGRSSTRTVLVSESEEDLLIDQPLLEEGDVDLGPELSEEVLLQDDEEDDEDNEGRSWRR